jgi:hypothetical protein
LSKPRSIRPLLVAAISVLAFAWCAALAAPADNDRFLGTLHAAHQGGAFDDSLAAVNADLPPKERMDKCSACHENRGWLATLVGSKPTAGSRCGNCHRVDRRKVPLAIGRPMGKRAGRPAHAVAPESSAPTQVGLRVSEDHALALPLTCGNCHPDHRGTNFVIASKTKDGKIDMHEACMGCHVPDARTPDAAAIRKNFNDKHGSSGDSRAEIAKALGDSQVCASCHGEHLPGDGFDKVGPKKTASALEQYFASAR